MEKYVEVALKVSVDVPMVNVPLLLPSMKCLLFVPASVSVMAMYGVMEATERVQLGVVVPRPKLPPESSRAHSFKAPPVVFLVEKVRADFGVEVEMSVVTAAILAVDVASVEEEVTP